MRAKNAIPITAKRNQVGILDKTPSLLMRGCRESFAPPINYRAQEQQRKKAVRDRQRDSRPAHSHPNEEWLLSITDVPVEKVRFSQNRLKIDDPKCIGDRRRSFIGHPSASIFERVF
jgi:hypothetical protein